MIKRYWLFIFLLFCFSCNQPTKEKREFLEVRINRWTALEGGETLVLRKVNEEWSAMLLGDGNRFSCYYQKNVQPKSGYESFWIALKKEGLLDIPDGKYDASGYMDGSGFISEVTYQDKLRRFSFRIPEELKTTEAGQILKIGDLISREVDTPMFISNYDRGKVGDYLIENCKDLKK